MRLKVKVKSNQALVLLVDSPRLEVPGIGSPQEGAVGLGAARGRGRLKNARLYLPRPAEKGPATSMFLGPGPGTPEAPGVPPDPP